MFYEQAIQPRKPIPLPVSEHTKTYNHKQTPTNLGVCPATTVYHKFLHLTHASLFLYTFLF